MQKTTVLNTAAFDARSRDALVLSLFEGLKRGESFVVVTEEGGSLCQQLDALANERLAWEFLERGPREIVLRVEKKGEMAPSAAPGGCCGCCGG